MNESTRQRLARALQEGGWHDLADRAKTGEFDDYSDAHVCPITAIHDLLKGRQPLDKSEALRGRLRNGEFDATREESDEWWEKKGRKMAKDAGLPLDQFERKDKPTEPDISEGGDEK